MPSYNYECEECDVFFTRFQTIEKRNTTVCPKCHDTATLRPPSPPAIATFKPGWFQDIAPDPIYVETPKQLLQECEKHECYSSYLENSGVHKGRVGKLKEI